ncbi:hypothetical protein [Peterkaempfera bronchialis]|uniref:Uncharacterized protein n=1 Tax=Peterkaempfera bronchialis TaxID=2126346 RepID=A0A345T4E4_9ACTN|nr:hypothetical protein [Peterkaempfera bronchialis]AXI80849.1 hypothetical protein C7M71_029205 [Peterkaempfera bronchialis]
MSTEISRRTALEAAAALAVPVVAATAGTAHADDCDHPTHGAGGGGAGAGAAEASKASEASEAAATGSEELAHYYRFEEIVRGRRMVQRGDRWRFEGPRIAFDPDGVHPVVDDPDTTRLPQGSRERALSEACDQAYTEVLLALQRVFDGHPHELRRAERLMFHLEKQAHRLVETPHPAGGRKVLGPAFRLHLAASDRHDGRSGDED